jgi:wyosine [tRNA(Phe)-imidazoG37] synthetase (radical SAM superfamily)
MYKYLFGPVPSRRLGMSLGVDLVPKKVCSLDCVYCEVGKTSLLSTERKEYVPFLKVRDELENYFLNNPDPDYITFSGSGEPTLNSRIGDVIRYLKEKKPGIPIAVLTNGTLLYDKTLRSELMQADLVLPSIDAVSEDVFKKINRPAAELEADKYIDGLISFSREFKGKIWLEIFILPGYNDSSEELEKLKETILKINPTSVQLNTLDRPGTVSDLVKAPLKQLEQIKQGWALDKVEIIAAAPARKNIKSYRSDTESAILETIARRPCTLNDLADILGLHISEINKYLDVLEAEGRVESTSQERGSFYRIKED